jgi:hypothetical protein
MEGDKSDRRLGDDSAEAEGNYWVPAAELRRIVLEAPADAGLLDDLVGIRGRELGEG